MTKQLLQRALDALENEAKLNAIEGVRTPQMTEDAIEELRAAIAAPEVEPVACYVETDDGVMLWPIADLNEAGTYCEPDEFPALLYTTPPDTEALRNNLRNAVNMFQTYVDGHISPRTGQAAINAFNEFLDAEQGGPA